jgi:hypothetical protein
MNRLTLPRGLRPSSLIDHDERRAGQARLDRDWKPLGRAEDNLPLSPPEESNKTPADGAAPIPAPAEITATPLPEPAPPAVVLKGLNDDPIVRGKQKKRLTRARYDVVKAMLDAGRYLTKDDLDKKSKHTDARKLLRALAESDPDWKAVIVFPEGPGTGYGIRLD